MATLKDIKDDYGLLEPREKALYLYLKAEKIASALHLLTDKADNNEPIRHEVRSTSIQLLSDIIQSCGNERGLRDEDKPSVVMLMDKLSSLLSIFHRLGKFSETSLQLVADEIDSLKNVFRDATDVRGLYECSLSPDFFNGEDKNFRVRGAVFQSENQPVNYKGHKGQDYKGQRKSIIRATKRDSKIIVADYGKSIPKVSRKSEEERREVIMRVLKQGETYSIKDILVVIPELGEKTIQRELAGLVASHRLTKLGDRRWSRYAVSLPARQHGG